MFSSLFIVPQFYSPVNYFCASGSIARVLYEYVIVRFRTDSFPRICSSRCLVFDGKYQMTQLLLQRLRYHIISMDGQRDTQL